MQPQEALRLIYNSVVSGLAKIKVSSVFVEPFEVRIAQVSSVGDLAELVVELLDIVFNKMSRVQSSEKLSTIASPRDALKEAVGMDSDYRNLEKLVQKYEAEIRKHVRVQQTMKIYAESLQEKLDSKERDLGLANESHKSLIKDLEKKITKAEKKAEDATKELKKARERHDSANHKKSIPQHLSTMEHPKNPSVDCFHYNKHSSIKIVTANHLRNRSLQNNSRDISPFELTRTKPLKKSSKSKLTAVEKNLMKTRTNEDKAFSSIKEYFKLMRAKTSAGEHPANNSKTHRSGYGDKKKLSTHLHT